MAKVTKIECFCDKCGEKIPVIDNTLHIVTKLSEPGSRYWDRLEVKIMRHCGINNDSKTTEAELCQPCAAALLKDAHQRVDGGERATAGVESSKEKGWG